MVTISHLVKDYVDKHPFIAEGLSRNIVSHPGLAEEIAPWIRRELKKDIKLPAIVMSLRRYSETIHQKLTHKKIGSQITLRSDVLLLVLDKNKSISGRGLISVTRGMHYSSAIIEKKYLKDYVRKGKVISDLTCISILFSKEYGATAGVLFGVTRNLAWNNINVVEVFSAGNELSIIIKKSDSIKALSSLEEFLDLD